MVSIVAERRETLGRTLLIAWLSHPRRSQLSLSKQANIGQGLISAWVRGDGRPGPLARDVLEILCGIPAHSWRTPSEQAEIDRVRAIVVEAA